MEDPIRDGSNSAFLGTRELMRYASYFYHVMVVADLLLLSVDPVEKVVDKQYLRVLFGAPRTI